jgi:hypothetical protein
MQFIQTSNNTTHYLESCSSPTPTTEVLEEEIELPELATEVHNRR